MKNTYKILTVISFLSLSLAFIPLPQSNIIRNLTGKLEKHQVLYPQQKVYLHLDKEKYEVGEKVWFKAYLADANSHKPDTSSTNLYVELINPSGYIVQTKLLKMENGLGKGDFSFQDTVPDGIYKIRAYTNYMQNFDEEYFFHKNIYVSNPHFIQYATRAEVKTVKHAHKNITRKQSRFDISFLPEGGHLLSNINNKVAFKAINELGVGIEISGVLKDKKGKTIVQFSSSHKGMGAFEFSPEKGNKYTAIISTEDGKTMEFPMPKQVDPGICLYAERSGDNIKVGIRNNISRENMPANTIYSLIAHIRGKVVFTADMDLTDQSTQSVTIPVKSLPSGILHLTLFNYKPAVISERLVFINNDDQLNISLVTNKYLTNKNEPVNISVSVRDKNGEAVSSEFSLSVSTANARNTSGNLMSYLLLKSDLKGFIEDPDYYFIDKSEKRIQALDYLMLTQGWRRFDWNSVILDQKLTLKYSKEKNIEITGRITRDFFALPVKEALVTLTIMDEFNDVFTTRTDLKGNYSFPGLVYYDTVRVKIEARKPSGKKNIVILVDGKEQEQIKGMTYTTDQYLKKPGALGKYLPEKEPEEEKDPFEKENTRIDRIHSEPKDVIIVDETLYNYSNVAQLLQGRIPGVFVSGDKVIIRGISTLTGSTDPLFLVDNLPVDAEYALSMGVTDIDRIEVLKGPEAAVYGIRGANGVIAIYTKRGKFMIRGEITFKMLGYSSPSEFYNPKYSPAKKDIFEDDRSTLLWIPELKTDINGKAEVNFYTSDIPGKYIITLEGLSPDGIPGTGISYIEIK